MSKVKGKQKPKITFRFSYADTPFNCGIDTLGEFCGGHVNKKDYPEKLTDEQWRALLCGCVFAHCVQFNCKHSQQKYNFSARELAAFFRRNGAKVRSSKTAKYHAYMAELPTKLLNLIRDSEHLEDKYLGTATETDYAFW